MTAPLTRRPPSRQQRQDEQSEPPLAGQWTRTLVNGKSRLAYVPDPLQSTQVGSPQTSLLALRDRASVSVGRLQGLVSALGESEALVRHALRREAVASARISGVDINLTDYLLYEVDESANGPGSRLSAALTAAGISSALDSGLARVRAGDAIGQRLLQELHVELTRHAKRRRTQSGKFRREAIAIDAPNGAEPFVPPPPAYIGPCVSDLERFIAEPRVPWLTRAALAFAQLLCIRPFATGNGRLARIALVLTLQNLANGGDSGLVTLSPSTAMVDAWPEAEQHLATLRGTGDFTPWLAFVFARLTRAADDAVACIERSRALFARDAQRIEWLGRSAASARRLHGLLLEQPLVSIPEAARVLDLTQPTVGKSVEHLRELGMLREVTGRERRRLFAYEQFLELLEPGGSLPAPPAVASEPHGASLGA